MIVGDNPGKEEDGSIKPFAGDVGNLLNKMMSAIKINMNQIYITNVINYLYPDNIKPEQSEMNEYSNILKEHISIISPSILILMGNTAKEAIFGKNKKISEERGKWKEIIIGKKHFKAFITFHPSYLLRKPDQKKLSWIDLKIIQKEIKLQNLNI